MMDPDRIAAIRARHKRVNAHFGICGSPQCFCPGPVCSDNLDEPWPCLLIQLADAYEQQAREFTERRDRWKAVYDEADARADAMTDRAAEAEARAAAAEQRAKALTQALNIFIDRDHGGNQWDGKHCSTVHTLANRLLKAALAAGGAACSDCGQPGLLNHACAQVAYPSAGGAGEP